MHVLQWTSVIVSQSQIVPCFHKKLIAHAKMAHVVGDGRNQKCELIRARQKTMSLANDKRPPRNV